MYIACNQYDNYVDGVGDIEKKKRLFNESLLWELLESNQ